MLGGQASGFFQSCRPAARFCDCFHKNNHPLNHQSIRLVLQRVAVEINDQPFCIDADVSLSGLNVGTQQTERLPAFRHQLGS